MKYDIWIWIIATLKLHPGFSAILKIWQIPACKMEPQGGYIMQLEPPTASVWNQKICLFLSMLWSVSTPIVPPINRVYMQCPALPLYVLLCSLPASPNLYLAPVELSIKLNLYLSGALLAELVDCKLWYCILCGIQYIIYVIWCMIYNISYVIWIMWHMVYNTSYRKYKIKDTIYDIWNIINII